MTHMAADESSTAAHGEMQTHSNSGRLFVMEAGNEGKKPESRTDTVLEKFAPAAKLVLYAVPYYGIAVLFYVTLETKPCESSHALHVHEAAGGSPSTCLEPWTAIDALYYTTVSMSTVGYGDISASDNLSRTFTAVWILVGIVFVVVQTAIVVDGLFEWLGRAQRKLMSMLTSERFEEAEEEAEERAANAAVAQLGMSAFRSRLNEAIFYVSALWTDVLLFLVLQLLVGLVILYTEPHFGVGDTVWYCFITATTVGFGDINVTTQVGRLLATVHILFSVIWFAALISHVRRLSQRRERRRLYAQMLSRRLDHALIKKMDRDGRGVDAAEFVVGSLIALGAEVGGEPLNWSLVGPMLTQFHQFDVDGDGRLTSHDLSQLAAMHLKLATAPRYRDVLVDAAAAQGRPWDAHVGKRYVVRGRVER